MRRFAVVIALSVVLVFMCARIHDSQADAASGKAARQYEPVKMKETALIKSVADLGPADIEQLAPDEEHGLKYYFQEKFSTGMLGDKKVKRGEFHYLSLFPLEYDSIFSFLDYLLQLEEIGPDGRITPHQEKLPNTYAFLNSISVTKPGVVIDDHGEWDYMELRLKFDLKKFIKKYPSIGRTMKNRLTYFNVEIVSAAGNRIWGAYFTGPDTIVLKQLRDKHGRFIPATGDWKPVALGKEIKFISIDQMREGFDF